ncbi:Dienelactone hydrolase family protein [Enhygromyxa salina]|uniref:Dienelactone hydrolase family protein n=1 Tax=Enhygromyxa salina TaxID=215803 RepID=A0A0C1ZK62_9BACT|nr:dienelactone hydrolase family protein [Enhygromyxa salina]KIG17859.1 Dienelactone hydrolase family protein [Enhygromyxa salina]
MRPQIIATLGLLGMFTVLGCAKDPSEPTPTATPGELTDKPATDPSPTGILSEDAFAALHQLTEAEAPPLHGQTIELGGGHAYLALPEGATGPVPAVVVIHEWWGLNDHIRHWADRLAEDGYAALAVDLYAGGVATDPQGAMSLMKTVDPAQAQAMLSAAHEFLATDPRIQAPHQAVIGWCFGGGWSLRDAIATPGLDAAVIYYGNPVTDPAELAKIEAPLLGVFANDDQAIPPAVVDELATALEGAGKSIELHRYDAQHAFANPSNARYQQAEAADAWAHTRRFLAKHLRPQ